MQNEIDLSQLFDEVEPLKTLNLGKLGKYPVYAVDNLPVAAMLRMSEVNARMAETGAEAQAEVDVLAQEAKGLEEDDPRLHAIKQRITAIDSRRLPIIREFVEVVAQMPDGHLKKLPLASVMKLFFEIQALINPKQEVETEVEGGKQQPLETSTTISS
jgi:hypothetical protein